MNHQPIPNEFMTPQPIRNAFEIFDNAYTDALVYGVGIVKMYNTPNGIQMTNVLREEYMALAKELKFVAKNTPVFTDKPAKG